MSHQNPTSILFLFQTEEEDVHVFTPTLLQEEGDQTLEDSPLQLWDSSVTSLVRSSVGPRCSSLPGDLYVLTGRGRLGPEAEYEETGPLFWSAMCCEVPPESGEKGFAVALVREAQGGEEQEEVSVERLEEMLGVTELFSGGCGRASVEGLTVGARGVAVAQDAATENVEHLEDHPGTAQHSAGEEIMEQEAKRSAEAQGQAPDDPAAQQEAKRSSGAPAQAAADDDDEATSGHSSKAEEMAEVETEPEEVERNSTIVYLISTSVYILTLPLRPVVSTITSIPGQVRPTLDSFVHTYTIAMLVFDHFPALFHV